MLDENDTNDVHTGTESGTENGTTHEPPAVTSRPRRRAAGRPAGPPVAVSTDIFAAPETGAAPAAKKAAKKAPAKKAQKPAKAVEAELPAEAPAEAAEAGAAAPAAKKAAKKQPSRKKAAPTVEQPTLDEPVDEADEDDEATASVATPTPAGPGLIFQAPDPAAAPRSRRKPAAAPVEDDAPADETASTQDADDTHDDTADDTAEGEPRRRRRSRGGRRRRKPDTEGGGEHADGEQSSASDGPDGQRDGQQGGDPGDEESGSSGSSRRRRSRRRAGEGADGNPDDPENTVVRVREPRTAEDEITAVTGSTRLEAKKQRRREGREAGRRRAPIVSEAEFLARRESVKREMVIRQHPEFSQIGVLEDDVLVEHYVARESQTSLIGNVYLGRVQNVLPSMEAAFIDIGKGRNAVLYAGEVDWSTFGGGKQRKIEDALQSGQTVLVQVTKDPIGQKGARLTSQISLPGRFLVYVPGGQTNGISRKLPDTERSRLKTLLKEVLPEDAGVIVRTAAEGATEDQLTRDVTALTARWEDIQRKVEAGKSPELLYSEPDLMIKVVRDLYNEDFAKLVVEGDDAWDMVSGYIAHVAPDLAERLERWDPSAHDGRDAFAAYRVDEQIQKALDRKVHLPSGGSLIIDRTEAMTVVDVNTGKFTGSGGNLEETVTKNNLEAAEEIVRQLRLRDIGGIIVIDFIDMVLESNRDLVLRRLVECLGRDRTRHQVAEVTSLGLVQMTRKRIGTGLVESFSTDCEHCHGRGIVVHAEPIEPRKNDEGPNQRRGRRGGRSNGPSNGNGNGNGGQQGNGGHQHDDHGNQNGNGQNGNGQNGNGGSNGGRRRGGQRDDAAQDESSRDETASVQAESVEAESVEIGAGPSEQPDVIAQAAEADAQQAAAPETTDDPTDGTGDSTVSGADTAVAGEETPVTESDPVLTDEGDHP